MRDLVVMAAAAALMVVVVESQQLAGHRVHPAQRRQMLDVAPFSHGGGRPPSPRHRRPPPSGFRGPPPSLHSSGSRPLYHGPPTQEGIGSFGPPFDPQQGTGHLPLDPRPNYDNPHFLPEEDIIVFGEEEALKGGDFLPIFSDDEHPESARETADSRLPSEHLRPPVPQPDSFSPPQAQDELRHQEHQTQEQTSPQEEHQRGVTQVLVSEVTPLQEEEPQLQQPPRPRKPLVQSSDAAKKSQQELQEPPQQLGGQQYEQETKEVVIVSAARPNHSPSTGPPRPHSQLDPRDRRPSHPNQLPLYNVIETHDIQEAESQERPYRVLYDYEDQEQEKEEEEEEEEEEEPDRLSILLLDSHFSCIDKKNGYYADEEVQCEVFHYCQDRVKHSWLCPQGASFHQVHLICIPRSEDNICEKSSKFHFVNEFLYKELDADSGSNKTYADRYYPEGFEHGLAGVDTDRQVTYPVGVAAPSPQAPRRPPPVYLDSLPHTQPQYHEDTTDPYVDRQVEQFARPHNAGVPQGFSRPVYRGGGQGFGNLEEVLAHRRPG